ncbi:hypothetical protein EON66_04370, partial [archaeon]
MPSTYDLYGVVVHHGSTSNSGHYFSFVKAANGTWCCMNDESVNMSSWNVVQRQQAYILFYTQRVDGGAPSPAPSPTTPAPAPAVAAPAVSGAAAMPAPPLNSTRLPVSEVDPDLPTADIDVLGSCTWNPPPLAPAPGAPKTALPKLLPLITAASSNKGVAPLQEDMFTRRTAAAGAGVDALATQDVDMSPPVDAHVVTPPLDDSTEAEWRRKAYAMADWCIAPANGTSAPFMEYPRSIWNTYMTHVAHAVHAKAPLPPAPTKRWNVREQAAAYHWDVLAQRMREQQRAAAKAEREMLRSLFSSSRRDATQG